MNRFLKNVLYIIVIRIDNNIQNTYKGRYCRFFRVNTAIVYEPNLFLRACRGPFFDQRDRNGVVVTDHSERDTRPIEASHLAGRPETRRAFASNRRRAALRRRDDSDTRGIESAVGGNACDLPGS